MTRIISNTKCSLIVIGVCIFLQINATAQTTLPSKVIGTTNDQKNVALTKTASGDYIITCTTDAANDSCFITKTDANLNTIWSKRFGYPGQNILSNQLIEKDNGNLLLSFNEFQFLGNFNNQSSDLMELDPIGNMISISQIGNMQDRIKRLKKTNDGNIINYGELEGAIANNNVWNCISLIKYDGSNVAPLWTKYYDYNPTNLAIDGELYGRCMTESSDDSLYILASRGFQSSVFRAFRVIHTDADGNNEWVRGYQTGGYDLGEYMSIDSDKNNYILGYTNGFGSINDTDLFVMKTNSNGELKWIKSYRNPNGGIYGNKILTINNNKLIMTGYTTGSLGGLGGEDVFLMELDTAGNVVWAKVYGDTGNEQGLDIELHPNGYLIAGTTTSWGYGQGDIYLINTDLNGNVIDNCYSDVTSLIVTTNETITVTSHVYAEGTFNAPINAPDLDTISIVTNDTIACCGITSTSLNITICDSYFWNGNTYTTTGTYDTTATNIIGCDSTSTLHLTILLSTSSTDTRTECDSYNWNGNTYNVSGSYDSTFTNFAGCDSVATLNLTITNSTSSVDTRTECDSYTWNGITYTNSGTYDSTFTNSAGCDSIATLNLTITNSSSSLESRTECDSYAWNGITYTNSGTYDSTFTNSVGCDSIATLILTINNSSSSSESRTECNSYTWNGITHTNSGTYDSTFTNNAGCDSIATLNLTINNSSSSSESRTECGSYTWNGITYTNSGTYDSIFTNNAGCDSIATLILTINNSSSSSESRTECDNYTWNGITYVNSGTYDSIFTNTAGCDSIATLILTINNSSSSSESRTECDSYTWNGITYTNSGTYDSTFTNIVGCDSIATLNLTIHNTYITNTNPSICSGLTYTVGTSTYNNTGNYTDTLTTINGCDSIILTNLTVTDLPVIIEGTNEITNCQNITLTATGADNYTWNNGSTSSSIIESPTENTTYTVIGTDSTGCTSVDSIEVIVSDEFALYIPNTFSPSSSQLDNKKLLVFGTCIESLELKIYDRWGELVFETEDINGRLSNEMECCIFGTGWDGTFNNSGKTLNSSSFAYIVNGTYRGGETFQQTGNITLK